MLLLKVYQQLKLKKEIEYFRRFNLCGAAKSKREAREFVNGGSVLTMVNVLKI